MIANCRGCNAELEAAYEYQQEGLHLAKNPFGKGHFALKMVNDKGELEVW